MKHATKSKFSNASIPPTTAEIIALFTLGRDVDSRWVTWAVSMLESGSDGPCLRILAGERPPFNQFEALELVGKVFLELGLSPHDSELEAAIGLSTVRAQQIINREIAIEGALAEISRLCIKLNYLRELHDFYLLDCAIDDLQFENIQYHWPDQNVNRDNIDKTVFNYCRKWLDEHSEML